MSIVTDATAGTITGAASSLDLGGSTGAQAGFLSPVPKAVLGVGAGMALFPPGSIAICLDPAVPPAGTPNVFCFVDVTGTWIQTDTYTLLA